MLYYIAINMSEIKKRPGRPRKDDSQKKKDPKTIHDTNKMTAIKNFLAGAFPRDKNGDMAESIYFTLTPANGPATKFILNRDDIFRKRNKQWKWDDASVDINCHRNGHYIIIYLNDEPIKVPTDSFKTYDESAPIPNTVNDIFVKAVNDHFAAKNMAPQARIADQPEQLEGPPESDSSESESDVGPMTDDEHEQEVERNMKLLEIEENKEKEKATPVPKSLKPFTGDKPLRLIDIKTPGKKSPTRPASPKGDMPDQNLIDQWFMEQEARRASPARFVSPLGMVDPDILEPVPAPLPHYETHNMDDAANEIGDLLARAGKKDFVQQTDKNHAVHMKYSSEDGIPVITASLLDLTDRLNPKDIGDYKILYDINKMHEDGFQSGDMDKIAKMIGDKVIRDTIVKKLSDTTPTKLRNKGVSSMSISKLEKLAKHVRSKKH